MTVLSQSLFRPQEYFWESKWKANKIMGVQTKNVHPLFYLLSVRTMPNICAPTDLSVSCAVLILGSLEYFVRVAKI